MISQQKATILGWLAANDWEQVDGLFYNPCGDPSKSAATSAAILKAPVSLAPSGGAHQTTHTPP